MKRCTNVCFVVKYTFYVVMSFKEFPGIGDSECVNPPERTTVHMGQVRNIFLRRGEKGEIFTYGLCGCAAVGIVSEQPSGVSLTLAHFDPTQEHQLVAAIGRALDSSGAGGARVLLMVPCGDKSVHELKDLTLVHRIQVMAEVRGASMCVRPYLDEQRDRGDGVDYQGQFLIEVKDNGSVKFVCEGMPVRF